MMMTLFWLSEKKALVYIENNLADSNGGMYLAVYSLTEINYIITGSNNVT